MFKKLFILIEHKTRVKYENSAWTSIIIICLILFWNFNLGFPTSKSLTLMSRCRLKVGTRAVQTASCRSNSWLGYFMFGPVSVSAAIPTRERDLSLVTFRPNRTKLDPCSEMAEAPQRPCRFFCHQCLADVSPSLPVKTSRTPRFRSRHARFSCDVFSRFNSVTCFTGLVSLG